MGSGGALIERGEEVAVLDDAIEKAAGGEGACVVLEGSAGIGKSRLLAAARERARGRGLVVLAARGGELERDFAYGVVRQLFERELAESPSSRRERLLGGAAELAIPTLGLARGVEAQSPGDISFPAIHGLYWLAVNLASEGPLLLELDDAHWADAPTLRFLLHVVARLEDVPLLITAAVRPGEPASDVGLLAKLAADPGTQVLHPAPLSETGVGSLIAELMGEDPAVEFAAACQKATAGNPFLLRELLAELKAHGLRPDAAAVDRVFEVGPDTVGRSLMLRFARLPEDCGMLARAVAVLGARAELAHAASLAGLSPQAAGRAADALAAVEILARERPLTFVHPVVRKAVYADLASSERAAMHARAARVLADAGAPAAEIAPHLLNAEPSGDAAVVSSLRGAARDALGQGAADLACKYLMRALAEPAGDERPDVLADLGTAEWLVGDPVAASTHLGEAVETTADPLVRAVRALTLARAIFYTGQVPSAVDVLEREFAAVSSVDGEAIDRLGAEIFAVAVLSPLTVQRALRRLSQYGEIRGTGIGDLLKLTHLSEREWMIGSARRCAALAERALVDGKLVAAEGVESITVYEMVWALAFCERHDEALELAGELLEQATRRGSVFGYATSRALLAVTEYTRGRMGSVEAEARAGLEVSEAPAFSRPALYSMLALALIERGALDEAEVAVRESGCGPFLPPMVHMNMAFYARAQLRLAQERPAEALADFVELGERDRQCGVENPGFPWRRGAAEAHLHLGNRAAAGRVADEHMPQARRWGTPTAIGVALHARGLAAQRDAPDLLGEAVDVLSASPAQLDHARALVDYGAALRRAGQRATARPHLQSGLDLARRCQATVLAERAHDELKVAGARPRRLQFSGLEALTASERRVAEIAAGGLTNREIAQTLFVTPKTVENQLGRVYSKLGVSSRHDLHSVLAKSVSEITSA